MLQDASFGCDVVRKTRLRNIADRGQHNSGECKHIDVLVIDIKMLNFYEVFVDLPSCVFV